MKFLSAVITIILVVLVASVMRFEEQWKICLLVVMSAVLSCDSYLQK